MKYIIFFLIGMFLSGCASIPEEYVGDWSNADTRLTIKKDGGLFYFSRQPSKWGGPQTTSSEWGIKDITNKEISGILPFNSIAIDGPPKRDESGLMFLSVEGNKLYWVAYKPKPEKSGGFAMELLNTITNDIYCKNITWESRECD